jgi:hypothetical protein
VVNIRLQQVLLLLLRLLLFLSIHHHHELKLHTRRGKKERDRGGRRRETEGGEGETLIFSLLVAGARFRSLTPTRTCVSVRTLFLTHSLTLFLSLDRERGLVRTLFTLAHTGRLSKVRGGVQG